MYLYGSLNLPLVAIFWQNIFANTPRTPLLSLVGLRLKEGSLAAIPLAGRRSLFPLGKGLRRTTINRREGKKSQGKSQFGLFIFNLLTFYFGNMNHE